VVFRNCRETGREETEVKDLNPVIGRRHFLCRSGKAAIGSAFVSGLLQRLAHGSRGEPQSEAGNNYGPFRMGFQSFSLRNFPRLDEFVLQAEKFRLKYVELHETHLSTKAPDREIRMVKQRLDASGIEVNAFGVVEFTENHSQNGALFEFARTLGAKTITASLTKDAFESLEKLVQSHDIRVAIHNHGPEDERFRKPEWILEAVSDLDPRIGACVDTGHYIRVGVDPIEAIRLLGQRVLAVHLKDYEGQAVKGLAYPGTKEALVGSGRLDLSETLEALQKIGFSGPLSLEYEDHPQDPVPYMLEELIRIRNIIARWSTHGTG